MTSSEDEIWRKFSQTVKPLVPKDRDSLVTRAKKIKVSQKTHPVSRPFLSPDVTSVASLPLVAVERPNKVLKKSSIDATLDLHGEFIKNAYSILVRFIEKAVQLDHRIILIITGKSIGKASTDAPRLVQMVPFWLKSPPLNQYVKKVTYANRDHGSSGAFYVFLRSFAITFISVLL